jgi:hypothetical protein
VPYSCAVGPPPAGPPVTPAATPPAVGPPAAAAAPRGVDPDGTPRKVSRTRRTVDVKRLLLRFPTGTVAVGVGEYAELGRDPAVCADAELFQSLDTMSARHLRVGLRADGSVWVKDLGSTNHTYRNGVRLEPQRVYEFGPGDRLRLALDIHVHLYVEDEIPEAR